MTTGIGGELVRIITEDGLELNGLLVEPSQKAKAKRQEPTASGSLPGPQSLASGPFCVVHVHGWDGNFYENRFIDHAARVCSQLGIGFVSGNNRGHDYISDILRDRTIQKSETRNQKPEFGEADRRSQKAKAKSQEPKPRNSDYVQIGGVYEKLTDCVPDIRAWVDFAAGRGAKRVILQGHSHGATKVAYYLITTHDRRICGLILLSPSDDMGIARRDLGDELFLRVLARARALMRAGRGRQLLPLRALQYPVCAATFFDCHNKDSITGMFNMSHTDREQFPELAAVNVPVLVVVGTVDEAFVGAPSRYVADIEQHMVNCPSFTGAAIDGAPHNYLEREVGLASVLRKWLRRRIRGVEDSRIRVTV